MTHKIVIGETEKTNMEICDLCERVNKGENPLISYAISQRNVTESFSWKPIELLLLSNEDSVKVGDLVYNFDKKIRTIQDESSDKSCKIIAAYPKIDNLPEFRFWFVQEWSRNPVDEVDVEYGKRKKDANKVLISEDNFVSCNRNLVV